MENDTRKKVVEFKNKETIWFLDRRRLAAIFSVAFIIFAFSWIQLMNKIIIRLGALNKNEQDAIADRSMLDKRSRI